MLRPAPAPAGMNCRDSAWVLRGLPYKTRWYGSAW